MISHGTTRFSKCRLNRASSHPARRIAGGVSGALIRKGKSIRETSPPRKSKLLLSLILSESPSKFSSGPIGCVGSLVPRRSCVKHWREPPQAALLIGQVAAFAGFLIDKTGFSAEISEEILLHFCRRNGSLKNWSLAPGRHEPEQRHCLIRSDNLRLGFRIFKLDKSAFPREGIVESTQGSWSACASFRFIPLFTPLEVSELYFIASFRNDKRCRSSFSTNSSFCMLENS